MLPINSKISSMSAFICYVILFFIIWGLRATVFYFIDESIQSQALQSIYSSSMKFILWVLPIFFYLKDYGEGDALQYLKINTKGRRKGLVIAIVLSIMYFLVILLFEYFTTGKTIKSILDADLSRWLMILLFVFLSPFSEEVLFRGFFLITLRSQMSFWKANALTAMLFVLIHWPYWLWSRGFNTMLIRDSLSILILALFLGYLVKITNSIWPSVVVHIVNNVISSFLQI